MLAAFAGNWAVSGPPALMPSKALHWLLHLSVLVTAVSYFERRQGVCAASLVRMLLIGVLLWRIMPAVVRDQEWATPVAAGWYVGLFLSGWVVMEAVARFRSVQAASESSAWHAGALFVWAAGCTAAIGTTSGEMALTLAAVCGVTGAALAASIWRSSRSPWKDSTATLSFLLFGALVITTFYASLPRAGAAVLLLAPLPAALASLLPGRFARPLVRLILLIAMVALGTWLSQPEPDPYGYGY